jgi:hypothetical protein
VYETLKMSSNMAAAVRISNDSTAAAVIANSICTTDVLVLV